jgi:hypothetical protein
VQRHTFLYGDAGLTCSAPRPTMMPSQLVASNSARADATDTTSPLPT